MDASSRKRRGIRIGLKEVADAANVSIATASLALADRPGVSRSTKQRVWQCCAELGYTRREPRETEGSPGVSAAAPKLKRVGFLLLGDLLQAPHNAHFLQSLSTATGEEGIGLQFASVDVAAYPDAAAERAMKLARDNDGLILMGLVDRVLLAALRAAGVPHVVVGHSMDAAADPHTRRVCCDEIGMGYVATESLIRAGHHRIGFVCETIVKGLSHWRWRAGYTLALSESGLLVDPVLTCVAGSEGGSGERAAEAVLAIGDRPTAFVIPSARIAVAFLAGLARRGLDVPPDSLVIAGEPATMKLFNAEAYPHVGVSPADLATASLDLLRGAYDVRPDTLTVVQVPFTTANLPGANPPGS